MAHPHTERSSGEPVIAFVGSTGSIQALRTILAAVDGQLGVPMIVLVHQSPGRPSGALTAALGHPAGVEVLEAHDGWSLRAGQILVVPAGSHMLITADRGIQLFPAGDYPPHRPSADLLLASMATALGPAAIAVVLSGSGSDGATGATAVHHMGGAVIATDRATSHTFSMPRATIERDEIGPSVGAVNDICGLLLELVARDRASG